ncbi:MAG: alginate export family protein, partial [Longimicrobiales bacterium]|nr:alginate export family protein [Longimicrobiales bacterium]
MSLKQTIRISLPLLLVLSFPAFLEAQATNQVTFSGQVRPRLESRTPVDGSWNSFTSLRVRAALEARLEGNVRAFVQFQDVRLFGEENNTLSDYRADNFDLHQGFLELTDVPSLGGALRVGRQELALGEQRLVGAVNWAQQGRSFDGFRYTAPSLGRMKVDLFAMKLREQASVAQDWESSLAGAYGTLPMGVAGSLDVYGLLTTDSREDNGGEITFGGLWKGGAGPVDLRFEGSLQTGQRNGTDVSAYMVGARAGTKVHESVTVTLWYDYLSGDDDFGDDEIGVFSTLFATNHGLYGLADYFTDIPVHTGGLGLQDAAVKFAFVLSPETGFNVDLHNFRSAKKGELSTRSLANELDLTLTYQLSSALTVMSGYSYVQAK